MLEKYQHVGKRLRKVRMEYGMSLNDVATATELSASFLSLLENGKTIPSLKVLDKLCTFFSIHMASLFEEEEVIDLLYFPKEKHIQVETENERTLRFLLPKTKNSVEPVLVTLFPHSENQEFTVHKGLELGYILEGTIEVHIQGRGPVICHEGDSILYEAGQAHRLLNPSDTIARGIWIGLPNDSGIVY